MRLRSPLSLAAIACATVLAGCASAPPTSYHTLMPPEPPLRQSASTPAVAGVLEAIRLPVQVDQPQWLVRLPDDTLAVLEQERWTSPLRDELGQAMREELIARWGMTEPGSAAAGAGTSVRIGIDVRRFDSVIGVEARIDGSWTLGTGDRRSAVSRCQYSLREQAGPGTAQLAAAHRRAIARLAAQIGANLGPAARGETISCPAARPPGNAAG